MSLSPESLEVSLFAELLNTLGDDAPVNRYTKATLVHISHQMEDMVLRHHLPAMIFTGFQKSSHWRQETARYRALAQTALQVCIFAGDTLPPESEASQVHVELQGDDPLRQEWFLLILGPEYTVLLCGRDNLTPTEEEATREFDTIWTFDVNLIVRTLDMLEEVVAHYRPDRIDTLREARRQNPPTATAPHLMAELLMKITQYQERLNQEMRWQQALTDKMLRTVPHHLYVLHIDDDETLNVMYESPNIEELLDTGNAEGSLTLALFDEQWIHPNDTNVMRDHLHMIRQGKDHITEFRLRLSSGKNIWVRNNITAMFDTTTKTTRLYGVLEDINERKQLEAQRLENERLQMLLAQEREYATLKTRFTEVVAHEFRTPLASISTTLYMLKRTRDDMNKEQYEERLDRIQGAVTALTRLMDEYMVMVGDEFGSYSFNPVSVKLGEYIRVVIDNSTKHRKQGQELRVNATDNQVVYLDPELVRLTLNSLLANAYQYTTADGIIEVAAYVAGDDIVISVKDNGPGIPPDRREQIFDAFYRSAEARVVPGLGLGLSVVRKSMALHGGSITVDSREGEGSTFTITLPIQRR